MDLYNTCGKTMRRGQRQNPLHFGAGQDSDPDFEKKKMFSVSLQWRKFLNIFKVPHDAKITLPIFPISSVHLLLILLAMLFRRSVLKHSVLEINLLWCHREDWYLSLASDGQLFIPSSETASQLPCFYPPGGCKTLLNLKRVFFFFW